MRAVLVVALLATLALAGCSSTPNPTPGPSASNNPGTGSTGGKAPQAFLDSGTLTASVGAGGLSFQQGAGGATATVEKGAKLLYAEMSWTGPTDLDLYLGSPSAAPDSAGNPGYDHTNEGGMAGSPDTPCTIMIKSPEAGDWHATLFAKGASAGTAYKMAVTVFYNSTELPAGYSAL